MTTTNATNLALDARMATQLSQREFAGLIGAHYSTVAHWETGKKNPSNLAQSLMKLISANASQAKVVLNSGTA